MLLVPTDFSLDYRLLKVGGYGFSRYAGQNSLFTRFKEVGRFLLNFPNSLLLLLILSGYAQAAAPD
jgi:hypothetical protein